MHRRHLLALAVGVLALAAPWARARAEPAPTARERQLEGWWARQREKEAADRFWNRPRELRLNATRDQIDRWEGQAGYRGLGPGGVARPHARGGPYRPVW